MTVKIEQDPEQPIERCVLAQAIVKLSEAADALRRGGLNEHAIVVLLCDKTRMSHTDVRTVLDGLRDLKRSYCS